EKAANQASVKDIAPDLQSLKQGTRQGTAEAWETYASALVEWAETERLGEAIEAYERALRLAPESGPVHFRLSVAYRKRYDSDFRQPGDFERAVEQWSAALGSDPNQHIWRRRIQQSGPRLDKPYAFYDWVTTARKEIAERGEIPKSLSVEPAGAEIAHPFGSAQGGPEKTFAAEQAGVN